ncbi:hypothetical protein BGZ49_008830 [Haplosporangium sp. Z 27]|nr:hypothetical protein BGZ49_008830 [Haplosporangium sp. Z 27]
MSLPRNFVPRTQGLQGSTGRNWHASARNIGPTAGSSSRMAGTLFYSVPTIDNDNLDTDEEHQHNENLQMHESFIPDYDSEDDESDSSAQSPPMSLFLDRQPQSSAPPLTPAAIYLDVPPPVPSKSKSTGSLGEQLLEPTAIPSGPVGWTSISYKRNFKDPVFAALYILALAAYFILGIVLLFTTSLACEILKDNPDMFFVSLGLMLIHVVFTAIWLLFFSRVFLVGHIESVTGSKIWVLEDNFYPIAAFMIFMYMWTSAVLSNVQRVTLANVVSKWYFHRHEPFAYHSSKITEPALINATTTLFGSICLGALFIAIVQFTAFALRSTAKKLKGSSFPLFVFIATCCSVIQGLVENFNNYTLIYVGITGESLFSAARSASKIFHRNLLWGLISDFLTKLILFVYSTLLSLLTGFAAYVFATHTLRSPYGYVIGILSAIIPFYITRFFTHIMAITVDATFLCYAIDLDTNTCHSNKAHSAFGVSH